MSPRLIIVQSSKKIDFTKILLDVLASIPLDLVDTAKTDTIYNENFR